MDQSIKCMFKRVVTKRTKVFKAPNKVAYF